MAKITAHFGRKWAKIVIFYRDFFSYVNNNYLLCTAKKTKNPVLYNYLKFNYYV